MHSGNSDRGLPGTIRGEGAGPPAGFSWTQTWGPNSVTLVQIKRDQTARRPFGNPCKIGPTAINGYVAKL
jgi:hypothetical protein